MQVKYFQVVLYVISVSRVWNMSCSRSWYIQAMLLEAITMHISSKSFTIISVIAERPRCMVG